MNPGHTYTSLLRDLKLVLESRGFEQLPQISSTQPFALSRPVALDNIVVGADATAGPVVRVPRPPCSRREIGGGFGEMLGGSDATGCASPLLPRTRGAGAHGARCRVGCGLTGGAPRTLGGKPRDARGHAQRWRPQRQRRPSCG